MDILQFLHNIRTEIANLHTAQRATYVITQRLTEISHPQSANINTQK